MSSSGAGAKNKPKKGMPDKDPYEVLGLHFGVAQAEISKAYRTLARSLHPDKLVHATAAQQEVAAHRFQEVQNARAFLLDPEHAADRAAYDNQRASAKLRQQTEAAREQGMSERRKRMRDELQRQEEEQQQRSTSSRAAGAGGGAASSPKRQKSRDAAERADLERQGRELREQYAAKAAEKASREQQQKASEREQRQIRLKWSRKKLKQSGESSPSEDSIAKQLSQQFGSVELVQMIGSKGNVALVTFVEESSCDKCVQAYETSEVWRASYVSKSKREQQEAAEHNPLPEKKQSRDGENVDDWKLRQAAERERLMREMQDEDGGGNVGKKPAPSETPLRPFPPPFPTTADFAALSTPFEKLEHAEKLILGTILSPVT